MDLDGNCRFCGGFLMAGPSGTVYCLGRVAIVGGGLVTQPSVFSVFCAAPQSGGPRNWANPYRTFE